MSTLVMQQKCEKLSVADSILKMFVVAQHWLERNKQRKQLAQLEPHMLKDIGVTENQKKQEVSKPFWV